ncbi:uncharacterized protein BJ212DRAFT_346767 [Suillus subaureus]|uniref:Uncharacterized protein n=1 Tax=Suillus subaureus TaxID=48587 RepID=A0A9P7E8Z9_9AGAM|nr:uncharacterized protein BJ212DRAFT_346767 [Suillus subaureus]KAG1814680.1 hypothetical protein BJ212DRAFT_346767 [Suillus subaureus]
MRLRVLIAHSAMCQLRSMASASFYARCHHLVLEDPLSNRSAPIDFAKCTCDAQISPIVCSLSRRRCGRVQILESCSLFLYNHVARPALP